MKKNNMEHEKPTAKKNVPAKHGSVIQMCGGITEKSTQDRNSVRNFFERMKTDGTSQKSLYVYSFVHSDGLGDAGQLKLLHDKVDHAKNELGLQRLKMLCAFSLTDQITQWRLQPENSHTPLNEDQITVMKEDRKSKIQNVCGAPEENIKYAGDIDSSADGQLRIRENAFDSDADWEIEYPVPDPHFMFPDNKADQLLKIKEMGTTDLSLSNCKAGDTSFNGIGYGIPDEFQKLPEENEKSAEHFVANLIPGANITRLLNKAWLVSVKNYIGNSQIGNKNTAFSEEKMNAIVNRAKECGAQLIIFAGMTKIQNKTHQTSGFLKKIHIICDDINHDTLEDLMSKITNGVIISGGEGLFAESLASPEPNTASVLAARYGFQYQEIAYSLLTNGVPITCTVSEMAKCYNEIMETYRIVFINNQFYYMEENKFIEILVNSIRRQPTSYAELKAKGGDAFFSKTLSALWLPLSINSNLQISKPKIFRNTDETLAVFKEQKRRLKNTGWFSLIDQAVSGQTLQ